MRCCCVLAVHLPQPRLFKGAGAAHAQFCEGASGKTVQQHGHGAVALLSAHDYDELVLLRRARRGDPEARRDDVRVNLCTTPFLIDANTPRLTLWRCLLCLLTRSSDSNPGAATPYSLYKLYSKQGAATANPYTLRQVGGSLNFSSIVHRPVDEAQQSLLNPQQAQLQTLLATQLRAPTGGSMRRRDDSPPRASFKLLSVGRGPSAPPPGITLSLSSLRS